MDKEIKIDLKYSSILLLALACLCLSDRGKRMSSLYVYMPLMTVLLWIIWNDYTPTILLTKDTNYTKDTQQTTGTLFQDPFAATTSPLRTENFEQTQDSTGHIQTATKDSVSMQPLNIPSSRYTSSENGRGDYMRRHKLIRQHRDALFPVSKRRGARVQYSPHTPDDVYQ